MFIEFDFSAPRNERFYVVDANDNEQDGRFAHIRDVLKVYPGAHISNSIRARLVRSPKTGTHIYVN